MMRCIPGSDRLLEKDEDEENLSSIARFEALMREADERKQARITNSPKSATKRGNTWGMELGEESSDDSDIGEIEEEDEDIEELEMDSQEPEIVIPTPAQRALDYISGRRIPLPPPSPSSRRNNERPRSPPIPFLNPQAMQAFHACSPSAPGGGLRPRTGTGNSMRNSRPSSMALPSRSVSSNNVMGGQDGGFLGVKTMEDRKENRRSETSLKRLSFQEFAKRLSSTSSLLLVQTNASTGSSGSGSHRSSEISYVADGEDIGGKNGLRNSTHGVGMSMRGGGGGLSEREREKEREKEKERDKEREREREKEKRCGWRGSVGVFGGEGGFL